MRNKENNSKTLTMVFCDRRKDQDSLRNLKDRLKNWDNNKYLIQDYNGRKYRF